MGLRFATQEFHIALATLYQRVTLRLAPGQPRDLATQAGLTLAPAGPVWVTAHLRE